VLRLAGHGERRQLGLDERRGVERLLVARRSRLAAAAAAMPRQHQRPAVQAGFVAEPAQRLQADLDHVLAAERDTAGDQGMGESRVVVGQLVLEPGPVSGCACLVCRDERSDDALEQQPRGRAAPVGIEAGQPERGVRARSQRRLRLRQRADERVEQASRRDDDGGRPRRLEDLAERPDRAPDVVADMRRIEPAPVVAHEVAHAGHRSGGVFEEGERPVDDRRPRLLVPAA
jgi:hypothetical protein